jgi:hypothetical protein
LLLLGIVGIALGLDYYPALHHWDFQNYSYLDFNQAMNFADAPQQGVPYDSSLVGYWSMNENTGSVAYDGSGNGNNGKLNGAMWVAGKFGSGLHFNGVNNSVTIQNSSGLQIISAITLSAWVKLDAVGVYQNIVDKSYGNPRNGYYLMILNNRLLMGVWNNGVQKYVYGTKIWTSNDVDVWYHVVGVFDGRYTRVYINGAIDGETDWVSFTMGTDTVDVIIGHTSIFYYSGAIDDVRIYNRALSDSEVAALYAQPDPASFANYFNYKDPGTNNTMLIHVDNPNGNSNNVALVTCTDFFTDNKLAFQANNSATVNVWTNLGQPVFTTGVWNSNNYTTTLTLDASSTAELNWNTYNITTYVDAHSGVSPSNVTVGYGGSQTFNFNASQGYSFNVFVDGVSQGQISTYIFDTVTAPHTINVTSTPLTYTITASADAHSTVTPGNVTVNFGGNQLFNMTAESGYYISHVYVDGEDQGNVSSYNFTNVQDNHTISVTSAALAPTNTPTPTASASPAPSQTPQPTTSPFPTETAVIAAVAIAVIIALFAFAFKKGYITIETVDEEDKGQEENHDDYSI